MSTVRLRYEADPADDVGKLWMTVQTGNFAGEGYFWSYRDGLRQLADELNKYPLGGPAEATWGYDDIKGKKLFSAFVSCRSTPRATWPRRSKSPI